MNPSHARNQWSDTQHDIAPPVFDTEHQVPSAAEVKKHLETELKGINAKKSVIFASLKNHENSVAEFRKHEALLQKSDRASAYKQENTHLEAMENLYVELVTLLETEDQAHQNAGVLGQESGATPSPRTAIENKINFYEQRLKNVQNQIHHNEIVARLLPQQHEEPQGEPFMTIGEGAIGENNDVAHTARTDRETIHDDTFKPVRIDEMEELPSANIKPLLDEDLLDELPESAIKEIKVTSHMVPTASGERLVRVARTNEPYQGGEFPHETVARQIMEAPAASKNNEALSEMEESLDEARAETEKLQKELLGYKNRIKFNEDGTAVFTKKSEAATAFFSAEGRAIRSLLGSYNKAMSNWQTLHRSFEKQQAGERAARDIERHANDTETFARPNLIGVDLNDIEGQKMYYDRNVEAARAQLEPYAKSDGTFPGIIEFTRDGTAQFRNISDRILARWQGAHPEVAKAMDKYNKLREEEIARAEEIVEGYKTNVAELSPAEKESREDGSIKPKTKIDARSFRTQRRLSSSKINPAQIKFGP